MYNLLLTAVIESLQDLFHYVSRLSFAESHDCFHAIIHTASLEIFHDNVHIFVILKVFKDLYDARMIQLFQYIQLIINSFNEFVRSLAHNFHRSYLISWHMHNHENFAASSLTNLFYDLVTFSIIFTRIDYKYVPKICYIIFSLFSNFIRFLGQ